MSRSCIAALCTWFEREQRDLPWRRQRSGYTALVAEAMSQQTQVVRVIKQYEAFIAQLPDVYALAAADEEAVLRLWNGLGYYRRARNLHAAAKRVVQDYHGEVPLEAEHLRGLPGVGPYTAGSIASIVGGAREPIVDANVLRVLQRWDADSGEVSDKQTIDRCWSRAKELVLQAKQPGVFNEALMELGATICTPRSPKCKVCPVARYCQAHKQGRQNEIPPVRKASQTPTEYHHAVVLHRRGAVYVDQRDASGLWAGLWQPPTIEAPRKLRPSSFCNRLPMRIERPQLRSEFEFKTSSRRVIFRVYTGVTRIRSGRWQQIDALDALPLSSAHQKVLQIGLQEIGMVRR